MKHGRFIVRTKLKTMSIYRNEKGGLVYSMYSDGAWSLKKEVCAGEFSSLSVCAVDEDVYIFCCDSSYSIYLLYFDGVIWTRKLIREKYTQSPHDIRFDISKGDGMSLIYNIPEGKRLEQLILHRADSGGRWEAPTLIDSFIPFNAMPFELQSVNNGLCVAYYAVKNTDRGISVGYREISTATHKWGRFNVIYSTGYHLTDQAFLTMPNAIHCLLVIKSMFSYQVLYMHKKDGEITQPTLLFEGQGIEKCLLIKSNNSLTASFFINGALYYCTSTDDGESFGRPVKYAGDFDERPMLSGFVCTDDSLDIRTHYIYTDRMNHEKVIYINDLCGDLYHSSQQIKNPNSRTVESTQLHASTQSTMPHIKPAESYEQISKEPSPTIDTETAVAYKSKLQKLKEQSMEKERYIDELTQLLKIKSDEIANMEQGMESRVRQFTKKLKEENSLLEEERNQLRVQKKQLEEAHSQLKERNKQLEEELDRMNIQCKSLEQDLERQKTQNESDLAPTSVKTASVSTHEDIDFIDWERVEVY